MGGWVTRDSLDFNRSLRGLSCLLQKHRLRYTIKPLARSSRTPATFLVLFSLSLSPFSYSSLSLSRVRLLRSSLPPFVPIGGLPRCRRVVAVAIGRNAAIVVAVQRDAPTRIHEGKIATATARAISSCVAIILTIRLQLVFFFILLFIVSRHRLFVFLFLFFPLRSCLGSLFLKSPRAAARTAS